jgi:hypothetical protein
VRTFTSAGQCRLLAPRAEVSSRGARGLQFFENPTRSNDPRRGSASLTVRAEVEGDDRTPPERGDDQEKNMSDLIYVSASHAVAIENTEDFCPLCPRTPCQNFSDVTP